MRMTILIPFVGTALLFNETAANWIKLPSEVGADFGLDAAQVNSFAISNLYFMYFGLISLGIASIVFGLFCPSAIQSNSSVTDALSARANVETPISTRRLFREICSMYMSNTIDTKYEYKEKRRTTLVIVDSVQLTVHDLFDDIILRSSHCEELMEFKRKEDFTAWQLKYAVNMRGDLLTDRIIEDFYDAPMAMSVFVDEFYEIASKMDKDVLSVWYQVHDTSRFGSRLLVTTLFVIGFGALAVPSSVTFFKVTEVLFRQLF